MGIGLADIGFSEAEKRVVTDRLYDRKSYREIAERDGVAVRTVRERKYRAGVRARAKGIIIPRRIADAKPIGCGSLRNVPADFI